MIIKNSRGFVIRNNKFLSFYSTNENGDWCFSEPIERADLFASREEANEITERDRLEDFTIYPVETVFIATNVWEQ